MSKKLRIIIAIIVIIILGVAGFFIAKKIEQENRKYNIENISEYNYFVSKGNFFCKLSYVIVEIFRKTIYN